MESLTPLPSVSIIFVAWPLNATSTLSTVALRPALQAEHYSARHSSEGKFPRGSIYTAGQMLSAIHPAIMVPGYTPLPHADSIAGDLHAHPSPHALVSFEWKPGHTWRWEPSGMLRGPQWVRCADQCSGQ